MLVVSSHNQGKAVACRKSTSIRHRHRFPAVMISLMPSSDILSQRFDALPIGRQAQPQISLPVTWHLAGLRNLERVQSCLPSWVLNATISADKTRKIPNLAPLLVISQPT